MNQYPISAEIISTGVYLPEKKEGVNDFLSRGVSREVIDKLGIYEHRVCRGDEETTDMEKNAALVALERAGLSPLELDLIISCSIVTEICGLPNSNLLQHKLGARNAAAFDISLTCCGIIPQLMTATNFIALGQYKYILVTNSTDWTRLLDPQDINNVPVLGDGASAVILGPADARWGFLAFDLQTAGTFHHKCGLRVVSDENQVLKERYYESRVGRLYFFIDNDIRDNSSAWARYLVKSIPKTFKAALAKANLKKEDVGMLILHQNINPLVNGWIKLCGVPKAKTFTTHHKYGNLSSANIITNLNELIETKRLKKNDIIAMVAQGAGFSVGSAILRWSR